MHQPFLHAISLLAFTAILLPPAGSRAQLPEKTSDEQCQKAIDSYTNEMKLVGTPQNKESLDRAYDATARLSDVLATKPNSSADSRSREFLSDACERFLCQADDAATKGVVDKDYADELARPIMTMLVEITGKDARTVLRRLGFINDHTRKQAPGAYGFHTHAILYENIAKLELLSRELKANIRRPHGEQAPRIEIDTDTPAVPKGVYARVPPRAIATNATPTNAPPKPEKAIGGADSADQQGASGKRPNAPDVRNSCWGDSPETVRASDPAIKKEENQDARCNLLKGQVADIDSQPLDICYYFLDGALYAVELGAYFDNKTPQTSSRDSRWNPFQTAVHLFSLLTDKYGNPVASKYHEGWQWKEVKFLDTTEWGTRMPQAANREHVWKMPRHTMTLIANRSTFNDLDMRYVTIRYRAYSEAADAYEAERKATREKSSQHQKDKAKKGL